MTRELERRVKEQTKEIIEREALFEETFSNAAVGMAHLDLRGHWSRVNNRLCEITGYDSDELVGMTVADLPTLRSKSKASRELIALLEGRGTSVNVETRFKRKKWQQNLGFMYPLLSNATLRVTRSM